MTLAAADHPSRSARSDDGVAHGSEKLLGWFGGPGRRGTAGMMEMRGATPQSWRRWRGRAELAGGLGLALGFLTALWLIAYRRREVRTPRAMGACEVRVLHFPAGGYG